MQYSQFIKENISTQAFTTKHLAYLSGTFTTQNYFSYKERKYQSYRRCFIQNAVGITDGLFLNLRQLLSSCEVNQISIDMDLYSIYFKTHVCTRYLYISGNQKFLSVV